MENQKTKIKALGVCVALIWIVASGIMIAALVTGKSNLSGLSQLVGIIYISGLILYLGRSYPHADNLPEFGPLLLPKLSFGKTLLLIFGVLAGGLCLSLSGLSGRLDGFQGFYLACIPVLFVGGGILLKITRLTHIHSVEGSWRHALKGFLWACGLALPPALLNISGGVHAEDAWVNQPWEPLAALVPGIAEETWARLFMTTLIYALLRPKTNERPTRALVAAVLIAALVHGLAHLPGMMVFSPAARQMLLAGLLFGVPMGRLFVKRDFEHAVGYYFLVDFVRFFTAF